MNKIKTVFIISIVTLALLTGCSTNKIDQIDEYTISANFVNLKDSIEEVYDQSDLVVVGEVTENYSYKVEDMIFTNYKVSISETISTKYEGFNKEIEVVQSGGTYNGEKMIFEDIQPLEVGDNYLFLLIKTWPEKFDNNFFTPSGAYQGIINFEQDKANKKLIKTFNKKNKIEKDITGKELDKIINKITK